MQRDTKPGTLVWHIDAGGNCRVAQYARELPASTQNHIGVAGLNYDIDPLFEVGEPDGVLHGSPAVLRGNKPGELIYVPMHELYHLEDFAHVRARLNKQAAEAEQRLDE